MHLFLARCILGFRVPALTACVVLSLLSKTFFFFNVDSFQSLYWICYNIASVLCFGSFWSWGMWDLTSQTRDQTPTPYIWRQSLNHWTTREVPMLHSFKNFTQFLQMYPVSTSLPILILTAAFFILSLLWLNFLLWIKDKCYYINWWTFWKCSIEKFPPSVCLQRYQAHFPRFLQGLVKNLESLFPWICSCVS